MEILWRTGVHKINTSEIVCSALVTDCTPPKIDLLEISWHRNFLSSCEYILRQPQWKANLT